MVRKAKILVTLGPASREPVLIEALMAAGANGVRINMSHGTQDEHAENIVRVRAAHALGIQTAFQEEHGLQCGFCTPGMLLRASEILRENPSPTPEQVREGIASNLCRCTGYQFIVEAILEAAERMKQEQSGVIEAGAAAARPA